MQKQQINQSSSNSKIIIWLKTTRLLLTPSLPKPFRNHIVACRHMLLSQVSACSANCNPDLANYVAHLISCNLILHMEGLRQRRCSGFSHTNLIEVRELKRTTAEPFYLQLPSHRWHETSFCAVILYFCFLCFTLHYGVDFHHPRHQITWHSVLL